MRLIDADLMVELIKAQITTNEDDKSTAGMAAKRVMGRLIEFVNDLPTAQPEIIRCKDCKYGSPNGKYGCKCYHYRLYEAHEMKPEDFCSHAERRTDG